jgi:hypothetical protein
MKFKDALPLVAECIGASEEEVQKAYDSHIKRLEGLRQSRTHSRQQSQYALSSSPNAKVDVIPLPGDEKGRACVVDFKDKSHSAKFYRSEFESVGRGGERSASHKICLEIVESREKERVAAINKLHLKGLGTDSGAHKIVRWGADPNKSLNKAQARLRQP